jgi:bifunctional enzyme CysN/CysC
MDICNEPVVNNVSHMNIVIVGHVDHGKSTVIGRLLADTDSLPKGKLEQIKEMCKRNSKPFEYAFLLDALKDERSQGITIDTARCFFKTNKRKYIIIDAPGHIEFLKNMITGASRAEAAMLVIDAHEGIQENSRRHGYMLSMLGIKQVVILINKMDLIDYHQSVYDNIVTQYTEFLNKINVIPKCFIPISAMEGDNITKPSPNMSWYNGSTVLEALDTFNTEDTLEDLPFRMPVQDVYKFTRSSDDRRIVAGSVETGSLSVGDEIIFYPSGKKTTVKTIEAFNRPPQTSVEAGYAAGFTTTEQIYVKRGELAAKSNQKAPHVGIRIKVSLFWLGKEPMEKSKTYMLKIGSVKVEAKLEEIISVMNAASLESDVKANIGKHDVAECIIRTDKPIAFDLASEMPATSRFVLIDKYEIAGGGIITGSLSDRNSKTREQVLKRNYKWEPSSITALERAEKYNQKAALILITGKRHVGKKEIAKTLEHRLFTDGKIVYFLGIGNVLYGIDADIKEPNMPTTNIERSEHIRRLGEVSNVLLDAGIILIVTAVELNQDDLEAIKTTVDSDMIHTIWIGDEISTDIKYDMHVPFYKSEEIVALQIKERLQKSGVIFKPW